MKFNISEQEISDLFLEATRSVVFDKIIDEHFNGKNEINLKETISIESVLKELSLKEDLRLFDDDGNPTPEARVVDEKGLRFVNKTIRTSEPSDFEISKRGDKYLFKPKSHKGYTLRLGKKEYLVTLVYEKQGNHYTYSKSWLFPMSGGVPKDLTGRLSSSINRNVAKSRLNDIPAGEVRLKRGRKTNDTNVVSAAKQRVKKADKKKVGTIKISDDDLDAEDYKEMGLSVPDNLREPVTSFGEKPNKDPKNDIEVDEVKDTFIDDVKSEFNEKLKYFLSKHKEVTPKMKQALKNGLRGANSLMNTIAASGTKLGDFIEACADKVEVSYKRNKPGAVKALKTAKAVANVYGGRAFKDFLQSVSDDIGRVAYDKVGHKIEKGYKRVKKEIDDVG